MLQHLSMGSGVIARLLHSLGLLVICLGSAMGHQGLTTNRLIGPCLTRRSLTLLSFIALNSLWSGGLSILGDSFRIFLLGLSSLDSCSLGSGSL